MLAIYIAILWYPICEPPNFIESILLRGTIPLSIFLGSVFLFIVQFKRNRRNVIRAIPVFVLTALLCMDSSHRAFEVERIMWEFEGVITKKYRSTNHLALSIEVEAQELKQYEYIDESFWDIVNEGDYIKKEKFSLYALLNGEKHICVRGYLLNKARGRHLKDNR